MSAGTSHVVVDAGHKSHAIDSASPRVHGRELEFVNGGDEHGILRKHGAAPLPALGETVWLIPGHCDPTVNLHEHYVVVRGGLEAGPGRSRLADRRTRLHPLKASVWHSPARRSSCWPRRYSWR